MSAVPYDRTSCQIRCGRQEAKQLMPKGSPLVRLSGATVLVITPWEELPAASHGLFPDSFPHATGFRDGHETIEERRPLKPGFVPPALTVARRVPTALLLMRA